MNLDKRELLRTLGRYKKHLIFAALAFGILVTTAVVGIGYTVFKVASIASEKVQALEPGTKETAKETLQETAGALEGFVMTIAGLWLEQGLASQDVAQLKQGLSCFDAVGGPSPQTIIEHVKNSIPNNQMEDKLVQLSEKAGIGSIQSTGSTACAQWLLNM
jgi:hypothetical protein